MNRTAAHGCIHPRRSEDCLEAGAKKLFEEIAPLLPKFGLYLYDTGQARAEGAMLRIEIDEKLYDICPLEDLETLGSWTAHAEGCLRALNAMLQSAGSAHPDFP